MKNLIAWGAVVAIVATGCTKNEAESNTNTQRPIDFQTLVEKNTKAPITGTAFPTTEEFGVFAFHKLGADYDYLAPYIKDVDVANTNGVWKTGIPFYWPLMGVLKFAAYGPYQASSGMYMLGGVSYSEPNGLTFTDYYVRFNNATNIQYQYDLMYSDEINDQSYSPSGVPLTFHHALTQITFAAVSADVAYKIKKIELLSVISKGTFKAKQTPQWTLSTNVADKLTYTVYDDVAGTTVPIQPLAPVEFANKLLLIPQATSSSVSIKVTFDATFNGETYTNVTRTYPLTGTTWLQNQRIKYTFKFAANEITYQPTISSWDVEIAGN